MLIMKETVNLHDVHLLSFVWSVYGCTSVTLFMYVSPKDSGFVCVLTFVSLLIFNMRHSILSSLSPDGVASLSSQKILLRGTRASTFALSGCPPHWGHSTWPWGPPAHSPSWSSPWPPSSTSESRGPEPSESNLRERVVTEGVLPLVLVLVGVVVAFICVCV